MKRIFILSMLLGGTCWMAGNMQLSAQNQEDERVLMRVNHQDVTVGEFLYVYEKNNQNGAVEQETLDQYLERYTHFCLKVAAAKEAGMDTTEAFRKELKGYRAQATPKYMKDEAAIDSLVQLSYQRMANMRRAAHIAIECPMNATDSQVQAAEKQIQEIRMRATTGLTEEKKVKGKIKTIQHPKEDFMELAMTYSTDPSAKENKGELGWITPFRYVYSFEDAIYNTPVGEITPVFRSPYGFHIAYVEEEQPTREVHAAHIMKMAQEANAEQVAKARHEIDSIYALLQSGADFGELARTQSDDKGSAMNNGDLGWFGKGMMVKPFEDAAFSMQEGTYSEPFQTRYGWHIIYLFGARAMQPLDSLRVQIQRNVQRDERMKEAEKSFLRKSRAEYQLPESMSDADVLAYVDEHLEEKYIDLKHLVKEYHDGILLFDISMREVWNKTSQDTAGLTEYFNLHKKDYTWDEPRYRGYVVYAANKEVAKRAELIIKNSCPDSIQSFIKQRINTDSVQLVKVEKGLWKKGQNPAVDALAFKQKDAYTPTEKFPVVKLANGKTLKAPEVYTDDIRRVTSDYQDYLDALWVKRLEQQYEVWVDRALFDQIKAEREANR